MYDVRRRNLPLGRTHAYLPTAETSQITRGTTHDEAYRAPSKSIAIKRSRSGAVAYGDDGADQMQYDMATWRMYNRIMKYRMSRTSTDGTTDEEEEPETTEASSSSLVDTTTPALPATAPLVYSKDIGQEPQEEDIFQLDL